MNVRLKPARIGRWFDITSQSNFDVRKVFVKIAAAFFILALPCMMAKADEVSSYPCSDASSHAEQRSCLESLFKETETRLTHAEGSAIANLAAWNEESTYRSKSRKTLLISNAAFRKYRTSQCEYVWSLAAGGNGATDMRLSCAIELTNNRIKQLEAYSLGLEKH